MAKALPGNKRKYGENLYSESYTPTDNVSGVGSLNSSQNKIKDLDSKANTQTKLENKPRNIQGVTGDRKLVREGEETYLYYKIEGSWFKTQLEKA